MKEKILELRRSGMSMKKIAKELDCSVSTVSYHCKLNNLDEPISGVSNKLDDDMIEKIRKLYPTTKMLEICNILNVSEKTVYKYCKDLKKIGRNDKKRVNNKYIYNCLSCGVEHKSDSKRAKFCSPKCACDYEYHEYIKRWKNGGESGVNGKTGTSRHIRRYIFEKYDSKCSRCRWGEMNKYTNKIPLELEHIDGDFTNNIESNLTLLCPNCHSLTPTYKGANKKQGRPRSKYYRGT